MAVDDHGLEVLKKAGEEVVTGNKGDYYIKVNAASLAILQFAKEADHITGTHPGNSSIYEYKKGGVSGTLLLTITVVYTDATRNFVSTVDWTLPP